MIDLFYKNVKILQSSQNCNKCCTDQGLHDYSHGHVSLPILKRNLADKRKNIDEQSEIMKNLKDLKKIVDDWLVRLQRYYKYEAAFGIHASIVSEFELKLIKEDMHKMTCSQVYNLEQATRLRQNSSIKQEQKQFQKRIMMDLQKYCKLFGKKTTDNKPIYSQTQAAPIVVQKISVEKPNNQVSLTKISQEKTDSVNKIKQNPQPQQQFLDITPSQSQQSNNKSERKQSDKPQQPKLPNQPNLASPKMQVQKKKEQIKNGQQNVVYHDPTLKISQLKYESTDRFFNVIVKVIKIINDFEVKGVKYCRFVAADDTGRSIFVTGIHPHVQVGKTIKITNCHLYIFHDKQKQIKGTRHSKFEVYPDLPSIHYNFDLSCFFEARQAELPIKYIKINQIQPGQEDLNMIVKIYKIIESKENSVLCYLGDQTGIVKAKLSSNACIRDGCSLRLLAMQSAVVNQHILVQQMKNSKVIQDTTVFSVINIENDVSQEEWAQQNQ